MKNKHFNLFDLIVVIIVLGIIAGIIFRTEISDALFSADKADFAVTLKIDSAPNQVINLLTPGTELYTSEGLLVGTVAETTAEPYIYESFTLGDREYSPESEYYSTAVISVSANGYVSDDKYFTKSGIELVNRESIQFETDNVLFFAYISGVSVITAQTQN